MNASEDGAEPLGEAPDVPARSGVAAVLDAADRVTAAVQAVAKIRELHPRKIRPFPGDVLEAICVGCGNLWPCSTIRAIDEAGA